MPCGQQRLAHTTVTAGKNSFDDAGLTVVVVKGYILNGLNLVLQQELLATDVLQIVLSKPLEGGVGLGHEEGGTAGHLAATLARYLIIFILHLTCQIRNGQHVIIIFKGQANHKVQLHAVPAGLKGRSHSVHQILFRNALIDHVAHLLAACFRSKSQAAFAHSLNLLGNGHAKAVNAQGGQGNAHPVVLEFVNHVVYHGSKAGVVGTGKGNEADFIVACVIHQLARQVLQHLRLALPHGAIHHARMAEAAAAATAAENLQHNAVMNTFTKGHNGRSGKIHAVHVAYHTLINYSRRIFRHGLHCFNSIILVIFHLVEGGHVNAADLDNLLQEALASPRLTGTLPRLVGLHNLRHYLFALTNNGEVKKIGQGLRVIHTGTAHDHQWVLLGTLRCQNRHAAQIQHVQNIGIAQLILQGEAHNIAFLESLFGFQGAQGNLALTHFGLQINPGSIGTLRLHPLLLIEQVIQNFEAQIAHAHLIYIGEGQTNSGLHLVGRLDNAGKFATGVARRLLHAA